MKTVQDFVKQYHPSYDNISEGYEKLLSEPFSDKRAHFEHQAYTLAIQEFMKLTTIDHITNIRTKLENQVKEVNFSKLVCERLGITELFPTTEALVNAIYDKDPNALPTIHWQGRELNVLYAADDHFVCWHIWEHKEMNPTKDSVDIEELHHIAECWKDHISDTTPNALQWWGDLKLREAKAYVPAHRTIDSMTEKEINELYNRL